MRAPTRHGCPRGAASAFGCRPRAEWEYAARAGTTSSHFWGDDASEACRYANVFDRRNEPLLKERYHFSWEAHRCEDAYAYSAPFGSFDRNPFGLRDMLGNVWEWVQDCWYDNYVGAPADGTAREGGDCARRVVRGGSWYFELRYVRSVGRDENLPDNQFDDLGFRLAQDL